MSKARISRNLLSHAVRHVVRLHRVQAEAHQAIVLSAESEGRFRNMADSAPVLLWVTDDAANCIYVNQVWLNFTGRTLADSLGIAWQQSVHPDDRERCTSVCMEAYQERRRFDVEYRLKRHDGEYRWVLSTGALRLLPDGTLAVFVGSCIDITERKLAEQERAELLARERSAREAAELAGRAKDESVLCWTRCWPRHRWGLPSMTVRCATFA